MTTTPLDANVPASPTDDNPERKEAAPERPPQDTLYLPTMFSSSDGDNPPPDCPQLVEMLAEYADDIDSQAGYIVFLLDKMPRLSEPGAEHALRRVGRAVARIANVATTAALNAHVAVEMVRGSHKRSGDNGGGVQS